MKKLLVFAMLFSLFVLIAPAVKAEDLAANLSGKILLQVEDNGEAWYVYPGDLHRYYLGRPADAFDIMRDLGYGITNADLQKIPVAASNLDTGFVDADNDGLSSMAEASFGTSDSSRDTDGDGYNDYEEIFMGYDPLSSSLTRVTDGGFAARQSGKIFLQVEAHGEAWYVDTIAYNRHYLGRPADAFNLMRNLGLGITNADLSAIPIGNSSFNPQSGWQTFTRNISDVNYTFQCPLDWSVDSAIDYGGDVSLTQCNKIYAGQYALDDGITVSIGFVPNSIGAYYEVNGSNYSYFLLQNILNQNNVSQYSNNYFNGAYSMSNEQHTFRFLARRQVGSGYIEIQAIAYGNTQTDNQYYNVINQIIESVNTY